LAIVVLTTVGYPLLFHALEKIELTAVLILNLRNALLVAFFLWVVVPTNLRRARAEVT
jgi:hypothetical protein